MLPLLAGMALLGGAAKHTEHKAAHKKVTHKPAHHRVVAAKPPAPPPPALKTETAGPEVPDLKPVADEDLNGAVPIGDAAKLPSTAEQYQHLQGEIARTKPVVANARQKSAALNAQAEALRAKLIATVARVQALEVERNRIGTEVVRLAAEDRKQSALFARDRVSVAHLLAVLERLQYDMPPAMALKPDDALGAARGAMLIGASVPQIYGKAAALAGRIRTIRQTRLALIARRAEAARNAVELRAAEKQLD
ncbi:MAG TPA: hypothetical protein VHL34_12740, partial [Rhizomicrobium sp.]|nr:hypothetical protein [Rhizomicrobium sp.]